MTHDRTAPAARLVVRDLACRRGERVLFEHFDLTLAAGDILWLRAPNGYGKTTLLRALAGIGRSEAGTIAWQEPSTGRLYLGHANALKDDLTVVESVRLAVDMHGPAASADRIDDAIARLGLATRRDAPVRTLSQGQRRRVALMRLCLSGPHATWILDEPFDALDVEGGAVVGGLLAGHAAGGGAVLLTSHFAPPLPDGVTPRTMQLDAVAA